MPDPTVVSVRGIFAQKKKKNHGGQIAPVCQPASQPWGRGAVRIRTQDLDHGKGPGTLALVQSFARANAALRPAGFIRLEAEGACTSVALHGHGHVQRKLVTL